MNDKAVRLLGMGGHSEELREGRYGCPSLDVPSPKKGCQGITTGCGVPGVGMHLGLRERLFVIA